MPFTLALPRVQRLCKVRLCHISVRPSATPWAPGAASPAVGANRWRKTIAPQPRARAGQTLQPPSVQPGSCKQRVASRHRPGQCPHSWSPGRSSCSSASAQVSAGVGGLSLDAPKPEPCFFGGNTKWQASAAQTAVGVSPMST